MTGFKTKTVERCLPYLCTNSPSCSCSNLTLCGHKPFLETPIGNRTIKAYLSEEISIAFFLATSVMAYPTLQTSLLSASRRFGRGLALLLENTLRLRDSRKSRRMRQVTSGKKLGLGLRGNSQLNLGHRGTTTTTTTTMTNIVVCSFNSFAPAAKPKKTLVMFQDSQDSISPQPLLA